jgi:hypothetical protein
MKYTAALMVSLALAVLLNTGCGGDNNSNGQGGTSNTNQPRSTATNNLAGHTLQFTVTQSVNFSEPEGAVYLVGYTEREYTFTPSPMNRETTMQEMGTYIYNPQIGAIHYVRPDHQDLNGMIQFDTPSSGSIHLSGPEGETEDANFVVTQ